MVSHQVETVNNTILKAKHTLRILQDFQDQIKHENSNTNYINEIDLTITSLRPTRRNLKMLSIAYPNLTTLTVNPQSRKLAIDLSTALTNIPNLQTINIHLNELYRFRGEICPVRTINIFGHYCQPEPLRSLLARFTNYESLSFQECLISPDILTIIKNQNIKKFSLINSNTAFTPRPGSNDSWATQPTSFL